MDIPSQRNPIWYGALLGCLALGACGTPPSPAQAPATEQVSLAGEGVYGTVRDETGSPVAGADVYIGVRHVPDPETPGACEDFRAGGTHLLGLVATTTDARGAYRQGLPPVEEATSEPNCLTVHAYLYPKDLRAEVPLLARSEPHAQPLPQGAAQVDLVLQPVPPAREGPRGRFRTPDEEWAEVARGVRWW